MLQGRVVSMMATATTLIVAVGWFFEPLVYSSVHLQNPTSRMQFWDVICGFVFAR